MLFLKEPPPRPCAPFAEVPVPPAPAWLSVMVTLVSAPAALNLKERPPAEPPSPPLPVPAVLFPPVPALLPLTVQFVSVSWLPL